MTELDKGIVRYLLDRGANAATPNKRGLTPLAAGARIDDDGGALARLLKNP